MERHGSCVRDLKDERLWLFEDGAAFRESWVRGESQAIEPAPDPAVRIEVQMRYLDTAYRQAWRQLNEAKDRYDVDQMRAKAELLKSLKAKIEARREEFDAIPSIREERIRQEQVASEEARRIELVALVKEERERKLREDVASIYEQACNETPDPEPAGMQRRFDVRGNEVGEVGPDAITALTDTLKVVSQFVAHRTHRETSMSAYPDWYVLLQQIPKRSLKGNSSMSVPNPHCCSDPRHLCDRCQLERSEQRYDAMNEAEEDNDDPLVSPVLHFNSDGQGEIHYPASDLGPDSGELVPPTINWAEVREEERRVANSRRQVPHNDHLHEEDDRDLLIPPRMVW